MLPSQIWPDFLAELQQDILPLYLHNEQTFDHRSIHGRMHICRAVLFAEFMLRHYYQHTSLRPDAFAVRYAIAFHDAGRQGSGPDLWEEDSARLCAEYLKKKGVENAEAIGRLITKSGEWSLEKSIVQDADVLEIMRPCCGHNGREGFNEHFLHFLGRRDAAEVRDPALRLRLIEEAWAFIQVSEEQKLELRHSEDYLQYVLGILSGLRQTCPLLTESLCESTS